MSSGEDESLERDRISAESGSTEDHADASADPEAIRRSDSQSHQASGSNVTADPTRPDLESRTDTPATPVSLVGTRMGDYQVLRKLGTGGMAEVYAARQLSLGRDVAFKVLRRDFANDLAYVERFRREARAAAKLNHPNIVQVYDVGQIESLYYIAQELVDGENLRERLDRRGVIDPELAVDVLMGVASALDVACEHGVIHRDIKPENIMRSTRGIVKVADFGLARFRAGVDASTSNLTQVGLTMGTPRYMSPEQVQGHVVDVRSDLYSLGVTVYHLLAGRPPFDSDDPLAVALQHLHETPIPLDRARDVRGESDPDLPEWLIAIVSRLMNKLPQDRYQSPGELMAAIRNEAPSTTLGGIGSGTAAATIRLQRAADQARRHRGRRSWRWTAAIVLPLLFAAAAAAITLRENGKTVSSLLRPDRIERADSVQDQYWNAISLDSDEGWQAVGQYFPPGDNATNASYYAKAQLQRARMLQDEGQTEIADRVLDRLIIDPDVDRVYQAIAMIRRCDVLQQLGGGEALSITKQRLRSLYAELEATNPSQLDLLQQVVSPSELVQAGIVDR